MGSEAPACIAVTSRSLSDTYSERSDEQHRLQPHHPRATYDNLAVGMVGFAIALLVITFVGGGEADPEISTVSRPLETDDDLS